MRNAVCALLAATLVLGGTPGLVYAQQSGQMSDEERAHKVEQLAAEGAKAYGAGKYTEAIELFEKAYALEPVPNLLYNIAKSYEKQQKYEEAVEYYQKFVVAPEVDSNARQNALQQIDNLREIAELEEDKSNQQRKDDKDQDKKPVEPIVQKDNSAALWTIGGGATLLAAGAVVGLAVASPAADEVKTGATYAERKAAQDDAQTYALVADGLLVAGAAVTGVGLYLYFSDSEAEPKQAASKAVVTPWVTQSSAGLGMSLDF